MRMYTDSADAIKAYAEEVKFDLSQCKQVIEIPESDISRGGLKIIVDNYHKKEMTITIHHNWGDLFDITFASETKPEETLHDQFFDDLMGIFNGLRVAITGISHEQWLDIMNDEYLFNLREEE